MPETYTAPLGAILTIVTGRLVTDLGDVWDLQDFLAGRALMTHERTEPFDRHRETLLLQFPRLAEAEMPPIPDGADEAAVIQHCLGWVAHVAEHLGWSTAEVTRRESDAVDPWVALNRMLALRREA